jgi:DNA-directed RNA polymerase subunit M/transcription elongation factor TFIIS
MAKGDKSKLKCKKCGTMMIAVSAPFLGTIFGKGGKNSKVMSQFVQCPKCKKRGIERLE